MAKIQSIAALVTTFFVRAQSRRREGMKSEARGVNEGPRTVNRAFERVFRSDDSVVERLRQHVYASKHFCG